MYVKASTRKTKDGQAIRYLQRAHNEWDAAAGVSRTKVVYSFGREDTLDTEAIRRLIAALTGCWTRRKRWPAAARPA